jgi:hypothetical protein
MMEIDATTLRDRLIRLETIIGNDNRGLLADTLRSHLKAIET